MKLLEVYTPEIESFVRYKVLDIDTIEDFVEENHLCPRPDYIQLVLQAVVFNLKTEVAGILRRMKKLEAANALTGIYNGCVMLNPGLDVDRWLALATTTLHTQVEKKPVPVDPAEELILTEAEIANKPKPSIRKRKRPLTRAKFFGLESHLKERIIGQNEAIETIVRAIKRSVTDIADDTRPLGVFLFAGSSGVGKTELAKELHNYIFGDKNDMIRIDCGEFQHKHENQKLIGSPPGYVGSEDGGQFTNQIAKNPASVILLDEVEKAHPDIWNTFLRVFDEGLITDGKGTVHSVRDSIIILTTNLGNRDVIDSMTVAGVGFGGALDLDNRRTDLPARKAVETRSVKAIRDRFRPEFLNRIDKIIVFNHLSKDNLETIADLEMEKLSQKLRRSGYILDYASSVIDRMIEDGYSPVEGARGISRVRRSDIEDAVCDALLQPTRRPPRGTLISIAYQNGEFHVEFRRPGNVKDSV